MTVSLRQIAIVARDLDAVVADMDAVFGTGTGYADPGIATYGLKNAVLPFTNTFFEIVCPVKAGTTADRFLKRMGGDGGYMVILQVDDIEEARSRAQDNGIRIADQRDLPDASFTHLHPKDVGGTLLSLDTMRVPSDWIWAGEDWKDRSPPYPGRIVGATVQGADPASIANRWSALIEKPVVEDGDGYAITVDNGMLAFAPAPAEEGDRFTVITLAVADPDGVRSRAAARGLLSDDGTLTIGGLIFSLEQDTLA